ncbi:hypothetical protein ACP275_04G114900 [Erythranthe tilingii]
MVLWPSSSIFFLLLLIALSFTNEISSLDENELLSLKNLQWRNDAAYRRSPVFSQKSRVTQNGATILEMKHTDFFTGPITGQAHKLEQRLISDEARVESIQSRIKNLVVQESASSHEIPINSGIKLQTLNYIVSITLAHRNLTLIVDTGSDLTWVQCQPCKLCYTQPEPLFNPSTSPSYKPVPCSSQSCSSLQYSAFCGNNNNNNNNANTCDYAVTYGDGSYTRGELGTDRLLLGPTPVENFIFGCGKENKGLFGAASGLMGLGRSDLSMISQTSDLFQGVFSYCLPDTDSATSGSLVLGSDTSLYKNSTPISYTNLVRNPMLNSFYVLNLTGITIGGVRLQSPNFGKNGILIDSGTVITRLPPSIYTAVKTEFLKQFTGYPSAPSFSILDTCFNLSGYEEVNIPTLRMWFDGDAEMTVDVSGMFYFVRRDASQVCLALASLAYEGETGIIGNYQQRNIRVVYDTKVMKVGFAKETCSFS